MSVEIKKESSTNPIKKLIIVIVLHIAIIALYSINSVTNTATKSKECLKSATITELIETKYRNVVFKLDNGETQTQSTEFRSYKKGDKICTQYGEVDASKTVDLMVKPN